MSGEIQTAVELTPEHPLDRIVELAVQAEETGYDAAFASSHYFNRDPYQALALIAGETEQLQIGPGVANPYECHPAVHAAKIATLDEVSGRTGHLRARGWRSIDTRHASGSSGRSRSRRVADSIRLTRRLWDGEVISGDGAVTTRDASLNIEGASVPIYVGAQGPQMLRMAGTLADGVLVNGSHPRDVAWAADQVAAADRPRENVSVLAFASVSVGPDGSAARESARPPVAFIAGGAAPPHLERHDIDESVAGTNQRRTRAR
ncbi:MAG: LLM class flavin-dependent oxidoreductase [Natrialbaceae archaeon]|nr:LLM class flavin-dependent oxidoreductase [Natrialbaceae archaeon]